MLNPRSRSRIVRLVLPISMALTALGAHVTSADDGTMVHGAAATRFPE